MVLVLVGLVALRRPPKAGRRVGSRATYQPLGCGMKMVGSALVTCRISR